VKSRSPEVRVLVGPSAAFRELAVEPPASPAWSALRRPLLLLLFIGCTVSLQASGRLSARLVFDGMVAFAFVPIFELIAIAFVYRRKPRRVTLSQAIDVFFVANAPWLVWLVLMNVWRSVLTPIQASTMLGVPYYLMPLSLIPMAIWTTYVDLQFFREVLSSTLDGARRELTLQRVISWAGIIGYFAGHEFWQLFASWINV
jgi:hypothetical protein